MIGETGFPERAIEKFTGAVAGEHAASSIRAVRSRGEADDEKPRIRIPETGNGPTPIGFAAIGAPLDAADFFAMRDQARTAATSNDARVEPGERIGRGHRRRIVSR